MAVALSVSEASSSFCFLSVVVESSSESFMGSVEVLFSVVVSASLAWSEPVVVVEAAGVSSGVMVLCFLKASRLSKSIKNNSLSIKSEPNDWMMCWFDVFFFFFFFLSDETKR